MRRVARRLLRPALLLLAIGVIAVFGTTLVSDGASALRERDPADLVLPLLVAAAAWLAIPLLIGSAWITLVADTTTIPPAARGPLMAAFIASWAARYVPGKITALGGRVYLAAGLGIPRGPLIVSTAVAAVLELLVATALGTALLVIALGTSGSGWAYALGAVLALAALPALHPRISTPALNRLLRLAGQDPHSAAEMPGARALFVASTCIAAAHVLSGLSTLAILAAVSDADWYDAPVVIGASALAGVVGILASVTPAGLGFREGALTATLGLRFAAGPAALASILSRAVAVVGDAALLVFAFTYDHFAGGHLRARLLRGAVHPGTHVPAVDPRKAA